MVMIKVICKTNHNIQHDLNKLFVIFTEKYRVLVFINCN
jgi:hypothetical protein